MVLKKDSLILADNQYYSLDCYETKLNNNVLVVGCSGSGKTRSIVTPNLLQATGSYIISDPKGNLYHKYGEYLERKGYIVKCLDFVHPERSVGYNPLKYLHSTQDIVKLANMLVYEHPEGTKADPFWDENATVLLASLIGMLMESKEKTLNFTNILTLISKGSKCNGGRMTTLAQWVNSLLKENPGSWACRQFNIVNVAPEKTFDSILTTLASKFRNFDSEEVTKMLDHDDINISSIGRNKTALFVVVSDTDRSMDNLANLFFTQAMNELCLYADDYCEDQRLPVPVRFILDDFATNCRINEFPRMISSIRSRGISTMLMIQSEAQLREGYGSDGQTIISNCDSYLYLGGNDIETARTVAERCDLPMKKILNMPIEHCWLFRRGQEPSYQRIFDLDTYIKEIDLESQREKKSSSWGFFKEVS